MRTCLTVLFVTTQMVAADTLPVWFENIEIPEHVHSGGFGYSTTVFGYSTSGGIAVFDCNDDDRPELFIAGGANPSQLFINTSEENISFYADTPIQLLLTGVTGAYPLDIDSDGLLDLAVLRIGQDLLLRGRPDCSFEPFPAILNFQSRHHWTTGFSATWESGQTLPTLAFGTYIDMGNPDGPFRACGPILLYRPMGRGYTPAVHLEPGHCSLSILFSDWARNGRADLRVSNDRHFYVYGGEEQLWAMEETPRLYTREDGWLPYSIYGMGIASRDMTGDGFPDIYLTSIGEQKFQILDTSSAGPTWHNAARDRGINAHKPHVGNDGRPSTGWHPQFGDVNNDGRDDLFITKGNVGQILEAAQVDPNNLLLQTANGQFVETALQAGVASMAMSRGGALVDLNLDGRLDMAVVNHGSDLEVFQNETPSGNWLLVDLVQSYANRNAVGGFIEVKTDEGIQTREITVGGGHASGIAGFHHFGLGNAETLDIKVIWPDGIIGEWQSVTANQVLRLGR